MTFVSWKGLKIVTPKGFEGESLDRLKVEIVSDGKAKLVPALHIGWAEKHDFVHFHLPLPPDPDGKVPLGAKEEWMEMMDFLAEDLQWLLSLEHHRFWSQVVYDMDTHLCLESYLQSAPRYYDLDSFTYDKDMENMLNHVHRLVFMVYVRMATYKESKDLHITPEVFGEIIYDNFIFDIPKIMDLCVLYAEGNHALLHKMVQNIFSQQIQYAEDIRNAVTAVTQVFDTISERLGEKCRESTENPCPDKLNLTELHDLITYLVDTVLTLDAFLDTYTPACVPFHEQGFEAKVASFYETVIPELSRKLMSSGGSEEEQILSVALLERLNLTRAALIKSFRSLLMATCVQPILEASQSTTDGSTACAEDLLQVMSACLPEKTFICDYQSRYPFEEDVDMLQLSHVQIDSVRLDYIMQGILLCFDERPEETVKKVSSSLIEDKMKVLSIQDMNYVAEAGTTAEEAEPEGATAGPQISGVELDSLISQVKDILPDLGDGFVESCLEYYNYSGESVINAVLEKTLPPAMNTLDRQMLRKPRVKVTKQETVLADRINVFDNDEFDVFTRDDIDTSKIHKGKKKSKYRDMADLLNDKSHVKDLQKLYTYLGSVDTTGSAYESNDYNDEYDDTYDEVMVGQKEPDAHEEGSEVRPFVTPRVLQTPVEHEDEEEEVEVEESEEMKRIHRDQFCQNPAEIRERAERLRQERWERQAGRHKQGPPPSRDVVGKAKGQGQDKQVLINRHHKMVSKRTSYNQRARADKKRNMGMMPT